MKKLDSLSLRSQVAETENSGIKIFARCDQKDWSTDPTGNILVSIGNTMLTELKQAMYRNKVKSELEERLEARRISCRGLFYFIKSNTFQTTPETEHAVKLLYSITTFYGLGMLSESSIAQSTKIRSLLDDLSTTEAKEALSQVPGSSYHVELLQKRQEEFMQSNLTFKTAKAMYSSLKNATELKSEFIDFINIIFLPHITVQRFVFPEMYDELFTDIKQTIFDHNLEVKMRASRKARKNKEM